MSWQFVIGFSIHMSTVIFPSQKVKRSSLQHTLVFIYHTHITVLCSASYQFPSPSTLLFFLRRGKIQLHRTLVLWRRRIQLQRDWEIVICLKLSLDWEFFCFYWTRVRVAYGFFWINSVDSCLVGNMDRKFLKNKMDHKLRANFDLRVVEI